MTVNPGLTETTSAPGRLLSIRRVSLSLAAGIAAGMVAVVLGAPELSAPQVAVWPLTIRAQRTSSAFVHGRDCYRQALAELRRHFPQLR